MVKKGMKRRDRRVSVTLPRESFDELLQLAAEVGVAKSTFAALALMTGARMIVKTLNPERYMTPQVAEAMARGIAEVEHQHMAEAEAKGKPLVIG